MNRVIILLTGLFMYWNGSNHSNAFFSGGHLLPHPKYNEHNTEAESGKSFSPHHKTAILKAALNNELNSAEKPSNKSSNSPQINSQSAPINQPPIANAGIDITITLPQDSTILNGCNSSDPENAAIRFKWRKISGPTAGTIVNDTICNTKIKSLSAGTYSFELAVTDTGLLKKTDTVVVTVNPPVSLSWPNLPNPLCSKSYKVVVLGSSTAAGTGASPIDSAWVNKMRTYMQARTPNVTVINLGLGGLTSYAVNPNNYIPPTNRPYPDTLRNITAALKLQPDAIIVNLPTNDAASAFTLQETKDNFERITALANAANVALFVATAQPRNNLASADKLNLIAYKDWVISRYGNNAIDFWTDIATADGNIALAYSAGDGVHVNNYGHHVFFCRVLAEKIWDTICLRKQAANRTPVANAGVDKTITLPVNTTQLSGSLSTDADNDSLSYNWLKINGPSTFSLSAASSTTTNVTFSAAGIYTFQLTVSDSWGASSKDTIVVTVKSSGTNISPVARAGNDITLILPANTTVLSGINSYDSDGSITSYTWSKYAGPNTYTINNVNVAQPSVTFSAAGTYEFELKVTDNLGASAKDSVIVFVKANTPPIANAGADQIIQLPVNKVLVSGRNSFDSTGNITSFNWAYSSGPAGSVIQSPSKDTTTISFVTAGVYVYRLTVTDNGNLTANDEVIITVNNAVTNKNIKVNVFDGVTIFNNSNWNNWNPGSTLTSTNFKYEDGTASSINATLSSHARFSDNGGGYGAAATICPPEVLRINSMHSIVRTLTLSGLTIGKAYNFEFYGSRGLATGSKTIISTGNKSDTIDTDFNTIDVARLMSIQPNSTGKIVFTIGFSGSYNYLAGFTISEPVTARNSILIPYNNTPLVADQKNEKSSISLYPNPAEDVLKINSDSPVSSAVIIDFFGNYVKQFWYYLNTRNYSMNISDLPKGYYHLLLKFNNKTRTLSFYKK